MSGLQFTWLKKGTRDKGAQPLLQVENLTVRVGIRQVLSNVSLEVYEGDHVRITGSNGCGKSTLLNAIAGVEPARVKHGVIKFDGREISMLPSHERSVLGIAYMRQSDNVFPGLSVADNLKLALEEDGPAKFQEAYPEWTEDLPLNKPTGQLSGGQKKKLAWAMTALRNNLRIALLDEPRAGVKVGVIDTEVKSELNCVIEIEHN